MSSAVSFRSFLIQRLGIQHVFHGQVPEGFDVESSTPFVFFARRGVQQNITFDEQEQQESAEFNIEPDEQFFDVELYGSMADVERHANACWAMQCYRGDFGDGEVQGVFIANQSDDYVPILDVTDAANLQFAFLSFEIRSYWEFD